MMMMMMMMMTMTMTTTMMMVVFLRIRAAHANTVEDDSDDADAGDDDDDEYADDNGVVHDADAADDDDDGYVDDNVDEDDDVAELDCTTNAGKPMCAQFGVSGQGLYFIWKALPIFLVTMRLGFCGNAGFPKMKMLFADGDSVGHVEFAGSRTMDQMFSFLKNTDKPDPTKRGVTCPCAHRARFVLRVSRAPQFFLLSSFFFFLPALVLVFDVVLGQSQMQAQINSDARPGLTSDGAGGRQDKVKLQLRKVAPPPSS
eukprot:2843044-Rhodomonas_salina.1